MKKTRILSFVSYKEIDTAVNNQDALLEQQQQDINALVVDLTSRDLDPEIEHQLNTYLDLNSLPILTEKRLEDFEIIEIILDKANQ
ncbi:5960_t:CDS:2, partial [Dentiscutata erythropus]